MKQKRILFVCKHNMFRSRVAPAYFKMINKDKNLIVEGAGVIRGYVPIPKVEIDAAKAYGIDIRGVPKGLTINMVRKQDMIIIVADDVPKIIFNRREYIDPKKTKILVWKIKDNLDGLKGDPKYLRSIVKSIMNKVDQLNKDLQKQKRK